MTVTVTLDDLKNVPNSPATSNQGSKGKYQPTAADFKGLDDVIAMQKLSPSERESYFKKLNSDDQSSALQEMQGNPKFSAQELEGYSNIIAGRPTTFAGREAERLKQGATDIVGGAVNPFLHIANLVLPKSAEIPDVPTQQGMGRLAGGLLGYAVPFKGASLGLEAGAGLVRKVLPFAEKEAAPIIQRIGHILKSSGAGAITGAATAPGGTTDRFPSAVLGAAGGAIGEGAGQLVSAAGRGATNIGVADALPKRFSESVPINVQGTAGENMLGDISQKYIDARNKSNPIYEKIFDEMDKKGQFMQPSDLQNYKNIIGSISPVQKANIKVHAPESFVSPDLEAIDSKQVHDFQSDLGTNIQKGVNNADSKIDPGLHSMVQDSVQMDLNNFLKKTGQLDNYKNATALYKKHTAPFMNIKSFKKNIYPILQKHTDSTSGEKVLAYDGLKSGATTTKIANQLLPTPQETDMGKLDDLTTLMGGDRKAAGIHAKNVMFDNTVIRNPNTGQMDLNAETFTNKAQKLSRPQRDFMFSPQEQKTLDALKLTQKARKPSRIRNVEELGTGAIIGHHLLPGYGTVAGLLAGIPVGEAGRKAIGNLLTRNKLLSQLTEKALAPQTIRGSRILAPALSGLPVVSQ